MPLFGIGLRKVHYLALQADKKGTPTPELDDALADNAPLVFGTLIIISTLLIPGGINILSGIILWFFST